MQQSQHRYQPAVGDIVLAPFARGGQDTAACIRHCRIRGIGKPQPGGKRRLTLVCDDRHVYRHLTVASVVPARLAGHQEYPP